jgi:hypothetical protein
MPVEFSAATYGLGHSLIRNTYQWNRVFNSQGPAGFPPGLNLLYRLSAGSGDLGGEATLPTDWVADWRRLYDFSEQPGGIRHPQLNFARAIATHLARNLQQLPDCATAEQDHAKSLAVRKLLRGRLVGLPAGQDVAEAFQVTALTPAQIASGPQAAIVQAQGFDTRTPLWYYILKEAEVQQGGQRLGQVGSRIVVETFHGLIEGSSHSILRQTGWRPTLPSQQRKRFTMTDLLTFVNDVNPLGD